MKEGTWGLYNLISNSEFTSEYLVVSFYTSRIEYQWEYCGKLADHIGSLLEIIYSNKKKGLSGEISIIANELLENAARFSKYSDDSNIVIEIRTSPDNLKISVMNSIDFESYFTLKNTLNELYQPQINYSEKYFKRLEEIEENQEESSGIGLLMILKDYPVKLGVQISKIMDDIYLADFQVFYSFSS